MRGKPALVLIRVFAAIAFSVVYSLNVSAASDVCSGSYAHRGIVNGGGHGKAYHSGNWLELAGPGSGGGYGKAHGKGDKISGLGSTGGYGKANRSGHNQAPASAGNSHH